MANVESMYSPDIQTPPEKAFGPATFTGSIWMSRDCYIHASYGRVERSTYPTATLSNKRTLNGTDLFAQTRVVERGVSSFYIHLGSYSPRMQSSPPR